MDMYIEQVDYVINRIGEDHVGIGTDWHGIPKSKAVRGFEDVRGMYLLETKMMDKFGSVITDKFLSSNAKRIISTNLS